MIPVIDFESFSEINLGDVGAWNYARHPSTEILCMSYDMRDGLGAMLWVPGWPVPQKLFDHIAAGGLVEAANSFFEYTMWTNHCTPHLGWPVLRLEQMRDVAAHARAWSLPGRLEYAAKAAGCTKLKDEGGHRVMLKLSKPRKPTKNNPATRWTPQSAPEDFNRLYSYCIGDTESEVDLGERVPQLSPAELKLWLVDQRINARGIYLDGELTDNCLSILAQMTKRYTAELQQITSGAVNTASEVAAMLKWLRGYGVALPDLTADTVKATLKRDDLPPAARRVVEIRKALASSSVKKLFAMRDMRADDGRARGLFRYCGATRTGRWGGADIQTQNLTKAGPPVRKCPACGLVQWAGLATCRSCAAPVGEEHEADWGIEAMELAIGDIASRDLDQIIACWGDPLKTLSGVLRGILRAAPGYEIVCGDYSAIEAVVIAALAGEEWRLEVFRTHGKIYEMSASKICGIPFEDFLEYKKANGRHHPMRNKIGKFAELACGFGGGLAGMKKFGADKFLSDEEITDSVKKWREASPAIVNLWYRVEECAHSAVANPGQMFAYRDIAYQMGGDVLYCRLPSGRCLSYHQPRLTQIDKWGNGRLSWELSFMGVDQKTHQWVRQSTYGGRAVENVVQATARDLIAHALPKLEAAGYLPILHAHDEIGCEVPEGWGSVEELCAIMSDVPEWARGWPVKAAGWRGVRYRKD